MNVGVHVDLRNLVVIFDQFNKSALQLDALRSLIPGEWPNIVSLPDPTFATVISYLNAGLEISFVPLLPPTRTDVWPRLQMQVTLRPPEPTRGESHEFPDILADILSTLPEEQITMAFGYNFNFVLNTPKKIHDVISLPPHIRTNSEFSFVPETFIKVAFDKDNARYNLDAQDGRNNLLIHVNVHHEISGNVSDLKTRLITDYNLAMENSLKLTRGVVNL